ncbi:MAG: 3-dehydroquinate synthase [Candidatus Omnitrophica bacterium]|nr:3-dehydroquinate synthase [Candidatus Omnitrophota bacterium]
MKGIKLHLGERSYDILISYGAISGLSKKIKELNLGDYAYILSHAFLKKTYGHLIKKSLRNGGIKNFKFRLLPKSEKTKSIGIAAEVLRDLVRTGKSKRVFLVAFGGGVITDLTGFIASVYKRGVNYIQIPTTLLAQVDAAIGGKTAIDLKEAKNIVGTFYQPRLVISDVAVLKTLDFKQLSTGLAEVIKYAVIKDKILFKYLEENREKIIRKDRGALEFIIKRSSLIKARIVEKDEKETKGIRTILNFGHTFAHAIETASGYKKYSHGQAVAIGMLCAADMSCRLNLLGRKKARRIARLIKSFGLSDKIRGVSLNRILAAIYYDKKFQGKHTRFVILKDIGKTAIKEDPPASLVRQVIEERLLRRT